MPERKPIICPKDQMTPACDEHPRSCPLEVSKRTTSGKYVSLDAFGIQDTLLPEDIVKKMAHGPLKTSRSRII